MEHTRDGLIGNGVESRVCDSRKQVVSRLRALVWNWLEEVLNTVFPFLQHLLSLQECNYILDVFVCIIHTSEIHVPFYVHRPLILSDSNKRYWSTYFHRTLANPPFTISHKSTFSMWLNDRTDVRKDRYSKNIWRSSRIVFWHTNCGSTPVKFVQIF